MTKFRKNVITVAVGALFCAGIGAGTISCLPSVISHAEGEFEQIQIIEDDSFFIFNYDVNPDKVTLMGFSESYVSTDYRYVNLVIPNSVDIIQTAAFAGNPNILSVTFPENLTLIEEGAFSDCVRLVEVYNQSSYVSLDVSGVLEHALNVYSTENDQTLNIENGFIFCENRINDGLELGPYLVGYLGDYTNVNLPFYRMSYSILPYAFSESPIETLTSDASANVLAVGAHAFQDSINLTLVDLPRSLNALGESAFEGCIALSDVTLSEMINIIEPSAFARCLSLQTIRLPEFLTIIEDFAFNASGLTEISFSQQISVIGESAFADCSDLSSISFYDEEFGAFAELEIRRDAFRNCSKLAMADLSFGQIVRISDGAFADTPLSIIYLPEMVTFDGDDSRYFDDDTILVFYDFISFGSVYYTDQLSQHKDQMTYIVNINFNSVADGTEDPQEVIVWERLCNKAYNFVRTNDNTWEIDESISMPVQTGYRESVWYGRYQDGEFAEEISDINQISQFLGSIIMEGGVIDQIDLYARYVAAPNLTVKTVIYSEDRSYSAYEIVDLVDGLLEVGIFDIAFRNETGEKVNEISDAGTYVILLQLSEYGEWENPYECPVTISPKTEVVSTALLWEGTVGTTVSNLLDGNIYVYNKNGAIIYSYSSPDSAVLPEGYYFERTLTLENSIARYRDANISLSLKNAVNGYYTASFDSITFEGVNYFGNNTAKEVGRYEAYVLLKANKNYLLGNAGGISTITNDTYGITITISQDGTQALVTKVWYIVEVGNALYRKDALTEFYSIPDWQYGDTVVIPEPIVAHADNNTYQGMVFTLTLNEDTTIASNVSYVSYGNFNQYINSSMPAGTYQLHIHVPDVQADDGLLMAFEETYYFTVTPAAFESAWRTDIVENLVNADYLYNGSIQLYHRGDSVLNLSIWNSALESSFNPERTGIWAQSSMDRYYSTQFELVYNINGMTSNTYYTYDELLDSRNLISPVEPGTYTVYYQFRAKNYESLTNESDDTARREYQFVILIYDEVVAPSLDAVEYTGSRIIPEVPQSPLYTIVYDNSETSYIYYGNYVITLTLNDPIHYKWVGAEGADYELNFEITRVKNSEALMLSVVQWSYGAYSDEANKPVWATQFVDNSDDSFYSYTLTSEDGKVYVYGSTEKGKGFGDAPYGVYTLTATAKGYDSKVAGSEGYGWLVFSQSIRIQVGKGVNVWTITPNVMQWRYGGYVAEVNLIFAEAQLSDANTPIYYSVTTDIEGLNFVEGLKDFTTENGVAQGSVAEALSLLTVGSYYLWASVAETEAFSAIPASPFEFRVTVANNYWEQAPSIVTWQQGDYDAEVNLIEALPHFGDTVQIVITVAGDPDTVVYDSAAEINNLSSAKAGVYELRATVAGTDDYEALSYSFNFSVFDKTGLPWWAVLLIVLAALGVLVLVFLILHVKGVLQLLSGKVLVAMRTKATVDATIAAVRANKVAANAKITVAQARGRELAEARAKAKASAPVEEPKETQVEPAAEQAASGDTSDEEFFPTNPNDET